ncbi:MAG: TnpV protein [Bifidobacterium longum]|nr:TnpV protein [Bifidobacterium longum]
MNITYSQNGDYRIPNIVIRKTKPIGHYGRLRKAYLETYRPVLFKMNACKAQAEEIVKAELIYD